MVRAYNRQEFKKYYGHEHYLAYWIEAEIATDAQKHMALLSVLQSHCDQLRMQLRLISASADHFDDAVDLISGSAD